MNCRYRHPKHTRVWPIIAAQARLPRACCSARHTEAGQNASTPAVCVDYVTAGDKVAVNLPSDKGLSPLKKPANGWPTDATAGGCTTDCWEDSRHAFMHAYCHATVWPKYRARGRRYHDRAHTHIALPALNHIDMESTCTPHPRTHLAPAAGCGVAAIAQA